MIRSIRFEEIHGLRNYLCGADVLGTIERIARAEHVPCAAVLCMSRHAPHARARFEVWRFLNESIGWSAAHIGRLWACNHTSVLTGLQTSRDRQADATWQRIEHPGVPASFAAGGGI